MRLTKDKKIMILSLPRTRTQWLVAALKNELISDTDMSTFFELNEKNSMTENRKDWPPHTPNWAVSTQIKLERKNYHKFATIRNPWERFASFYLMVKKAAEKDYKNYASETGDRSVLNRHAMTELALKCNFHDFIHHVVCGNRTFDLMPAFNFFLDNNGNFDIDHIFDFEDTIGIKNFFTSKGYQFLDIHKGSPSRDWKSLYDKSSAAMIAKYCELEIRYFGYTW